MRFVEAIFVMALVSGLEEIDSDGVKPLTRKTLFSCSWNSPFCSYGSASKTTTNIFGSERLGYSEGEDEEKQEMAIVVRIRQAFPFYET